MINSLQRYKLIPDRDLHTLRDVFFPVITEWSKNWCSRDDLISSFSVVNSYEMLNTCAYDYLIHRVELIDDRHICFFTHKKHTDDPLMSLVFSSDAESNDLTNYVINNAVKELVTKLFKLNENDICKISSSFDESMHRDEKITEKGDGSVVIVFKMDDSHINILVPVSVYEKYVIDNNIHENSHYVLHDIMNMKDYIGGDLDVDLKVQLSSTKLKYEDLLSLSVNDVLVLDHKLDDKLKVMTESGLLCGADIGTHNGRLAVILK